MIHNIVGKDIKIILSVGGAVTPIATEPLNQNSVGTHKLYVYSDVMTGADIMLFAYFAKGDFNTGELFMQPIPSDKDGLNLWQLTIPATALKERGQWSLAVEIRQEVSYIVVTEGASETKTGYKRLAHGNINFTVQQSVVQDSIYPEQEVYTPEQNSQYENVIIILNEQSLTLNAHGDELERLEADKQDKVDERLDGLGGNDVVGAIIATKQTADDIDGKATQAQQDAADALEQVVGKYTKPESGIPATDLAAAVQTSLGKADTALQAETDPTVPSWAKQPDKPEYTAAEIAGLETITNLTNYYRKTETYTQTEVNNLISAIPKLTITVVEELPAVGDPTKIYVIGNKEYLWLANEERYEQFGDLSVDLSGYYDKDDVDGLLAGKVDKVAGKGLSENDYTTDEKDKLTGIATGAQVNVKSDWNAVSGDAEILNKPTIPAEQVNADWNAGSGKAQILNKPTIPSAYTLPTASDMVKGGIKVGAGLQMDGEVLSATGTTINVEVLGDWS